jgi:hypothetical protein
MFHPVIGRKGPSFSVDHGTRWGWVVNATPRPLYPRERSGTHCTGGWVVLGAVWTGAENFASTFQLVASRCIEIQGGANMTGTNCNLFTHK